MKLPLQNWVFLTPRTPPPPGSAPEVNKISSVKNEIVQLESRFLLVVQQGNSVGEANFIENNKS